jgi:hypothetical protein
MRYHLKGWDLEGSHEFGQEGVAVGVAKHWKLATARATWHTGSKEATLQYCRG